jgi:hypothetical protein
MAFILLVVQAAVALVPGRVLCIPLRDCGVHMSQETEACKRNDAHSCGDGSQSHHVDLHHADTHHAHHDHESLDAALHREDDCGCHVHVPTPDDQHLPGKTKPDSGVWRSVMVWPPLVTDVTLGFVLSTPSVLRPSPTEHVASDRVRALKATRLLI